MSKGSAPRPFAVTQDEYASNWDRIFGSLVKPPSDEDGEPGQEHNSPDRLERGEIGQGKQ